MFETVNKVSQNQQIIFQKQAEDWAKQRKDVLEEKRRDLMKKQRLNEDLRQNQAMRYVWILDCYNCLSYLLK